MKKEIIFGLILIAGFIISGCATSPLNQNWVRNTPGGTDEELNKDKYECMKQSQQRVLRSFGGGVAFAETETNKGLFNACMEARGYSSMSK
jgi:hypothetical protein